MYFTLDGLLEKLVSCLKGNETYDSWHSTMKGMPLTEEKLWSWIEKAPLVVLDEVAVTRNRKETWYGNTRDHFLILKRFLDLREFTPHVVISNKELGGPGKTGIAPVRRPDCIAAQCRDAGGDAGRSAPGG
jgi:hypothetical protein